MVAAAATIPRELPHPRSRPRPHASQYRGCGTSRCAAEQVSSHASPSRPRLSASPRSADTELVASIHTNRGFKRARTARQELGFGTESPLPDLLEAVEGPGGASVVVLDLGDGIAGAHLVRSA